MKLHLDTDFAGDTDDACALAMVLGWPGADLVGVTTTADADGRRAGYAGYVLDLVGRGDVPLAAGAGASLAGFDMGGLPDHERYWGQADVPARPSPPDAAIDLLDSAVQQGATIAAIGPLTNLALLERARPGRLRSARIVAMGGWVHPPGAGLPAWGPDRDWNIQCDPDAARLVAQVADLTLSTLPATMRAHLRAAHLPRLAASGPLGALLARQGEAHALEHAMRHLAAANEGLPRDLLNFQYDPVACAVALGWDGATVQEMRLRPARDRGALWLRPHPQGRPTRVVTDVDGEAFAEAWLRAVEAAQRIPVAGRHRDGDARTGRTHDSEVDMDDERSENLPPRDAEQDTTRREPAVSGPEILGAAPGAGGGASLPGVGFPGSAVRASSGESSTEDGEPVGRADADEDARRSGADGR